MPFVRDILSKITHRCTIFTGAEAQGAGAAFVGGGVARD